MCGIGGIVATKPVVLDRLHKIVGTISHRGPDDSGVWFDDDAGIGFAHTRLAIIDLSSSGHQPMTSVDQRYVMIFNGEIYNHLDLRRELEAAGAVTSWRGHSDTESLLAAIAHWGLSAAIERSSGMFAIALFDRQSRTLSLARDRFGEKPLYYGWIGGEFLFGSELKALIAAAQGRPRIADQAVHEYASRGYVPAPLSIYENVYKLEPGCILRADVPAIASRTLTSAPTAPFRGDGILIDRYWDYRSPSAAAPGTMLVDKGEAMEQLEAAIASSVRKQSTADVPIGAFLSGGVDSSLVVALYQKYCTTTPRTFTIGFEDVRFNEAGDARQIAQFLGTEHRDWILTPDELRDCLSRLPAMFDEPFADSSQVPTHLVSAFARQHVKVAISGDGGDELFGGYNRHVLAGDAWSRASRWPTAVRKGAGLAARLIPAALWTGLASIRSGRPMPNHFGRKVKRGLDALVSADDQYDFYRAISTNLEGEQLLRPAIRSAAPGAPRLPAVSEHAAHNMMYWDSVSYLPDDILCKVDRASMAASLEVRVPLLDHHVAEVAGRIPLAMKIDNGVGKAILRDLLRQSIPPGLVQRPKAGFAIPVGSWLRNELRPWAEELLAPQIEDRYFDGPAVTRLWRAHQAHAVDAGESLWTILMFRAWLREWS